MEVITTDARLQRTSLYLVSGPDLYMDTLLLQFKNNLFNALDFLFA